MDPPPPPHPPRPTSATPPPAPRGRGASTAAGAPDGSAAANTRDLHLVQAVRSGDRAALGTLLARYQDRLYIVCLRMVHNRDDAAELTQGALLRLIRSLDQFDGRSAFSTWAIRVAMNLCLSHLRGAKLRRHTGLDQVREVGSHDQTDAASPGESIRVPHAAQEHRGSSSVEPVGGDGALARALAGLEAQQRAILVLRDVRGLDYDQIAYVLDVPAGTVKSRLFRARAALRAALESPDGDKSGDRGASTE